MKTTKTTKTTVPVQVGQFRRDPDRRMDGRVVRVLLLGATGVYEGSEPAAVCQSIHGGIRTRIRLRRLERWEVVGG